MTALNQGMRLPGGQKGHCMRHRLMLAIENNACRDYVSDNLCQALQCGAIPVIKSVWSDADGMLMPDYQAIYGDIIEHLVVNASRPGWLAEVRMLMTNDTEYTRRHQRWVTHGQTVLRGGAARPRADPGNWHCQWYDATNAARSRAGVTDHTMPATAMNLTWPQCACPKGLLSEFNRHGEFDEAKQRKKMGHRWMSTCATPPE